MRTNVYVGNADTSDINVFALDAATGALALVQTVAVPGIAASGGSTPLAVSPDKTFLYMGLRGDPMAAATFSIDATGGKLKHIGNGPLAASMAHISTDRTGRYLLGASYGDHCVTVNPIGADGVPQPCTQKIDAVPNAHMVLPDASNGYVFAAALGGDVIRQYVFRSGSLAPNSPPAADASRKGGARHFVFHPDGKTLYLLGELDGSVGVFDFNAAMGTLQARAGDLASVLPDGFNGKIWAADLRLTPDGKFLYGTERTSSTITGFAVEASGNLRRIGTWPTEKQPRGIGIDPSSRYLFAVGQLSHSMTSYAIDRTTGKLTALRQYPTGKNPNWIEAVDFNRQ